MAGDLRAIVSSIQMVADVERMGALAARRQDRPPTPSPAPLPEEVNGYFAEMGRLAVGWRTAHAMC